MLPYSLRFSNLFTSTICQGLCYGFLLLFSHACFRIQLSQQYGVLFSRFGHMLGYLHHGFIARPVLCMACIHTYRLISFCALTHKYHDGYILLLNCMLGIVFYRLLLDIVRILCSFYDIFP